VIWLGVLPTIKKPILQKKKKKKCCNVAHDMATCPPNNKKYIPAKCIIKTVVT
jgi:hypothetical protein